MDPVAKSFERQDAEAFLRLWSLYYNRSVAYAPDHPSVQELVPRVYEAFQKILPGRGAISIILQELGFFIGHLDVAYQPNNRKIADHLKRFGIDAITIDGPFTQGQMGMLLEAGALTHADAASFLRYLKRQGMAGVSVNNVSLQTVKEGESVGKREGVSAQAQSGPGGAGQAPEGAASPFNDLAMQVVLGHITAQEMQANLSFMHLLENPGSLPQSVAQVTGQAPPEAQEGTMKNALANVLQAFPAHAESANMPVEDILQRMYGMRNELLKAMRAQEGLAKRMGEGDQLPDAAEELFADTASQLILKEHQKHKGNLRKTAQIIHRIVPEKRNLHRVLNKVRQGLLEQGAPLMDYYNLLSELNVHMGADEGYRDFLRAGDSVGLNSNELLKEINANPKQAAQLIVLASEMRKIGKGGAAEEMIRSLTDLVDQASGALGQQASGSPEDAPKFMGMLHALESEIGRELESKDLPEEAKTIGRQHLHNRLQHSLLDLKGKAALSQLRNPSLSEGEKAQFLMQLFVDEKDLDATLGSMGAALGADAVVKETAERLMAKVRQEMETRRAKSLSKELPGGVYVKAVLDFFIKFEISRATRYDLPFSALLVSFQGLPEDKTAQEAHGDTLRGLQNVLVTDMRKSLRDSDFVGYLAFNRFIIVTPMTRPDALVPIIRKFRETLTRQVALPDGSRAWVRPRCGTTTFDKDDLNSYPKLYASMLKSWQADT